MASLSTGTLFPQPVRAQSLTSALDSRAASTIPGVVVTARESRSPPVTTPPDQSTVADSIGQQTVSGSSQAARQSEQQRQTVPQQTNDSFPSLVPVDLLAIFQAESDGSSTRSDELLRKLNETQRRQFLTRFSRSSFSSSSRNDYLLDPSVASASLMTYGQRTLTAGSRNSVSTLSEAAQLSVATWSQGHQSNYSSHFQEASTTDMQQQQSPREESERGPLPRHADDDMARVPQRSGDRPTSGADGNRKDDRDDDDDGSSVDVKDRRSVGNNMNVRHDGARSRFDEDTEETTVVVESVDERKGPCTSSSQVCDSAQAPYSLPRSAYATLEDFVTDSMKRFCVSADDVEILSRLRHTTHSVFSTDAATESRQEDESSRCGRALMERSLMVLRKLR